MSKVHPTAIVDPACELADDADIGPWCVLTGRVRLQAGVRLVAAVHLNGPLTIGPGTIAYPNVCLGFPPQDVKFKLGDPTAGVVIGRGCILRESATVHAATKPDTPTTIGDRAFIMVGSHVGHDARLGDDVTLVNSVHLGGHSSVGDRATIGGGSVLHQFGRIGRLAFISGASAMACDVPPFCVHFGRNTLAGINLIGMRRAGMPREHITRVREAFRRAFWPVLTRPEMLAVLQELGADCPPVMEMARFVAESKRPICPSARRKAAMRGTESEEAEGSPV